MKAHLRLVKGPCGSDDESPAPAVLEQTERQRLLVQTFLPMVGKAASSISRRYRGSVSEAELLGPAVGVEDDGAHGLVSITLPGSRPRRS
mgnify:CR=1 FL=1